LLGPTRLAFEAAFKSGDIAVIDSAGREHRFGDGTPPLVRISIADRATEWALGVDPELALGESYMSGKLAILDGTIYDLLDLIMGGSAGSKLPWFLRFREVVRFAWRRVRQFNPVSLAERRCKHHYDIDLAIYDMFLDPVRQYSCAYFDDPSADLCEAQRAKLRHIAAKLDIKAGERVLDIGCGWGGLAAFLAAEDPKDVLGITLSPSQLNEARQLAVDLGLEDRVRFEQLDYRKVDTTFDKIVSVGMFEHVGVNHYRTFFTKIHDLLDDNGVALIHSIGRSYGPGYTNPFIAKYIFPGGYFPALSEVLPAVEASGLIVSDIEILRLHYAETLKAWREAFVGHWDEAAALKGEEFCRMWEFYLAGSESAFRHDGLVVFQMQLIKRLDALPITRDYMTTNERTLGLLERAEGGFRLAGE
jgi:cyclopropane-fatty-acyl-phospholipid synthase